MCIGLHVKYPLFLSDFNGTWIFVDRFSHNTQIFTEVRPLGTDLFHADGQTNRHDEAKVAFRKFANAPNHSTIMRKLCYPVTSVGDTAYIHDVWKVGCIAMFRWLAAVVFSDIIIIIIIIEGKPAEHQGSMAPPPLNQLCLWILYFFNSCAWRTREKSGRDLFQFIFPAIFWTELEKPQSTWCSTPMFHTGYCPITRQTGCSRATPRLVGQRSVCGS
jgi:hypothetical protein